MGRSGCTTDGDGDELRYRQREDPLSSRVTGLARLVAGPLLEVIAMNETEQSEIEFARHIKERLDAGIADMDAATLARLRQAREQALEIAAGKHPTAWQWWPAQFGLATAAALVAAVIWQLQPFPAH